MRPEVCQRVLPSGVRGKNKLFAFILSLSFLPAAAETLTLSQALREALERNSGYQAARNDTHYADVARDSAWAGYLPVVTTNAGLSRSWLDTRIQRADGSITDQNGAQSTGRTAGVNGDWTLFQGFSGPLAQKRLKVQYRLAQANEGLSRDDLVRGVVLAYADLSRQTRLYQALDTAAAISEERLRILQRSLDAGAASRSDWLSARVDRNADQSALRRQNAALQSARISLAQLLGRKQPVTEDVDSGSLANASGSSVDLAALLNGLPDNRPDLRAVEANRALAEVGAQQRAFGWLPRVDALAGYNYSLTQNDVGTLLESRTLGPSVGLQLNFGLFTGEFPWQPYGRARIALNSAELRKNEAVSAAEAEVRQDYAALQAADSALALERQALGDAQENLGLTFMRWKSGSLSYVDARRAQDQYLSAFTLAENAGFDALSARLELLRSAGRLGAWADSASH